MNRFTAISTACALTITSLQIATPATAEEYPEAAIKSRCAQDYPTDFFLQKGCIDLQRMSFDALTSDLSGMPEATANAVAAKCAKDYGQDYFLRKGCNDLQAQSWRSLNN